MQRFQHDGVEIAFFDEGEGDPIVLVHGFASTAEVNWVYPGWVATLTAAGRRVIALDNRGHGASSKLYDPAAYHSARMAEDVRALLDHLDLVRADVMGYSMGARIAAFFALAYVSDSVGRTFRAFAEQTKSDLEALAACIRGSRQTLTRAEVTAIRAPVLIAVGTKDVVAGSAHELAALLPSGRTFDIPGRDHMLAVADKAFKAAVLRFLAEQP